MLSKIKNINHLNLIMSIFILWVLGVSSSWGNGDNHAVNDAKPLINQPNDITYDAFANLTIVGQTTLKWLWVEVYDAKLMTPSGKYQTNQWPLALALTYKRNIKSKNLVKSTEKQWKRLEMKYQQEWLSRLQAIWPDVKKGDEIMLGIDKHNNAWFFYNGDFIGGIEADDDTEIQFSYAFSQIWLSEKSLVLKSRNELIGAPNG